MTDFLSRLIKYNNSTNMFFPYKYYVDRDSYYFDSPEKVWVEVRNNAPTNNTVVVGGSNPNDYNFYSPDRSEEIFKDIENRFVNYRNWT